MKKTAGNNTDSSTAGQKDKAKKAAGSPASGAEIALLAYLAWEKDGMPAGKDQQYWFQAEAQLSRGNNAGTGAMSDLQTGA